MTDWGKFWENYPKTVSDDEYQKQVYNTVKGEPCSQEAFQEIVSRISEHLELQKDDILLELCCGNGVVTVELAKKCKEVIAVDFSEPLLAVANRVHSSENITYQKLNILQLNTLVNTRKKYFNKILLHTGLQYFKTKQLQNILENIIQLSSESRLILFTNIPDKSKKWKFLDTYKRKLFHIYYKISGQDRIGTWWDKQSIEKICQKLNLKCEFLVEGVDKRASHYRFDVKIYSEKK